MTAPSSLVMSLSNLSSFTLRAERTRERIHSRRVSGPEAFPDGPSSSAMVQRLTKATGGGWGSLSLTF